MNGWVLFAFVFEIWAVMFLIWGAFHEDKLIMFERKIAERIKKQWIKQKTNETSNIVCR